jgi:cobalamin biosynthetic protein CobC
MSAPIALAHGGGLDAMRRIYPKAPEPWIDLSTGVNPHAYPVPEIAGDAWKRLPDDDALALLEAAARHAYGASNDAAIVAAGGTQALIQLLPRVFAARRVAVLGFTYAEHAASWRNAKADVAIAGTLDALRQADVAVIVNPNNPDGRLLAFDDVSSLAHDLTRRGALLVVDESFVDFAPVQSVATLASLEGVIVLRSFGKAYGLAGLRLGFALCAPGRARLLRAALGPWAVSGPALAIGAQALADEDWRSRMAAVCAREADRLDAVLARAGFEFVGGAPLFRLVAHLDAARRFAALCEKGILARAFVERPSWLRFGLPGDEGAWERLTQALERAE